MQRIYKEDYLFSVFFFNFYKPKGGPIFSFHMMLLVYGISKVELSESKLICEAKEN